MSEIVLKEGALHVLVLSSTVSALIFFNILLFIFTVILFNGNSGTTYTILPASFVLPHTSVKKRKKDILLNQNCISQNILKIQLS